MTESCILAIDQGTSSSRAVVFDRDTNVLSSAQQEFRQHYPKPGWVEHDPEEIWSTIREVAARAMSGAGIAAGDVAAIGITNQRETTCIWDRADGRCIYNAIVWQDRRTAISCAALRNDGLEGIVAERTGLRLDPYFSASKIAWILDNVDGARRRAEAGELAFGTIDSFLLWRLTGGAVHATDATNASRTALFNIRTQQWDQELLDLFRVPPGLLPEVLDCAADFGTTRADLFDGGIAICGVAGDQQAALIGQACLEYGMTKSTYGTGCFVIANTGNDALVSHNQLLTTIAARLDGKVSYGLEGSVFVAGSAIKWLRDELGIIESAAQSEAIARKRGVVDDVWVVPAFAGLGAPWWDPDARGAILGLTRGSSSIDIVTATLQAVAYQTRDLADAMADDGIAPSVLRVDGGMVANDWFLQFLADVLAVRVERPVNTESTVLGAAYLAALATGIVVDPAQAAKLWRLDKAFEPSMQDDQRDVLLSGWRAAVERVRGAR